MKALINTFIFCLAITLAEAGQGLEHGAMAPDFTVSLSSGETVTLASLKGKVVYLDFWASWCSSCATSLPWISTLEKQIGSESFRILTINLDRDQSKAEAFLRSKELLLPVAYDPKASLAKLFSIKALPVSFLISKDGKIIYFHEGFSKSVAKDIVAKIHAALRE